MFGLDARIALSIFSIMVLIVGFVGYGRLDMAREASLLADVDAIENAVNHYQTDMGTFYPFSLNKADGDDDSTEDLSALWDVARVKEGFQGHWHGPYVQRSSRARPPFGMFTLFYAQPDRQSSCTAESACSIWLSLSKVPAETWKKVNAYYDEAGGTVKEAENQQINIGRVQSDGPTDPRLLLIRLTNRPQQ